MESTNGAPDRSSSGSGGIRRPDPRSALDWLRVLRDGLPAVILLTILGILAGIGATMLQDTEYQADATLVAGSSRGFLEPEWADGISPVASTVTRLASSAAVLRGAGREYVASAPDQATRRRRADEISLKWLRDHLTASQVPDSGIVDLSGKAGTQKDARALTEAGTRALERSIVSGPGSNVPIPESAGGRPGETRGIVVRDFQTTDEGQVSPTPLRNVLLGINVGLILGIIGGLALGARRRRLRRPEEMAAELGIPILATVRSRDTAKGVPRSLQAARARLQRYSQPDHGTVFLLTGPVPPQRMAEVGAALARTFAASSRTVLVDADLSGRYTSRQLELDGLPGLGDLLDARSPQQQTLLRPEQVLVTTVHGTDGQGEIEVLPAGESPADVAAALNGSALARSIQSLRLRYEFVIVVGPGFDRPEELIPLSEVADWSVLLTPRGERASTFEDSEAVALTDALAGRVAGAVIVDRRR